MVNPKLVDALNARGLDPEVVVNAGVYSARRAPKDAESKTPIPDIDGTIACYPFFDEKNQIVNTKYVARKGNEKLYFQTAGGKKIFYNLPVVMDPILQAPDGPGLLIVEGENDVLACITAGYPHSIGVPDGGSPDKTEAGVPIPMKPDDELDPDDDTKFEFIVNCWPLLQHIPKIVLWMDWDGVGDRLIDELSRRLDKVRCYVVRRPAHMHEAVVKTKVKDKKTGGEFEIMRPVKDANEVLQYYGGQAVQDLIASARPMPMMGLYTLDDFQDRELVVYSTGFRALDPYIKIYDTMFAVVSGLPGSGKSLLWNQIMFNMAYNYGWKGVLASFEMPVKPELQRQLRAFYIRKPWDEWTKGDVARADEFIREHFTFITRDPTGLNDVRATPEWVCEQAENAVIRFGVNMLTVDPWNQLDHVRERGEMRDEYTITRIRKIKDMAARLRIATTVIAHPTAEAGRAAKDGSVLSMYDMADGASWNNAAEYGVIVHRRGRMRDDTICEPYIRKVKFKESTGTHEGNCAIQYIPQEMRFDEQLELPPLDEDIERSASRR